MTATANTTTYCSPKKESLVICFDEMLMLALSARAKKRAQIQKKNALTFINQRFKYEFSVRMLVLALNKVEIANSKIDPPV